jgi:DNA-binding NarL/FixJ family response regulator
VGASAGTAWILESVPVPADLSALGWEVRPLAPIHAPLRPRSLLVGVVADAGHAAALVAAVAGGASAAAFVEMAGEAKRRLLDDLERLGADVQLGMPPPPPLAEVQIRLLDLLVGGASVLRAADELNVSRRTANRMLEELRARFGVRSNAEVVQAWAIDAHRFSR